MSISQNFPEVSPSLTLDFANSRRLDPRITFTRSSTATYVGSNGLIKTAPVDEARFDHNPTTGESLGLLVEEQRTNTLLQSNQFDTSWTLSTGNPTISLVSQTAPDGGAQSWKLTEGSSTGLQDIVQTGVSNSSGSSVYSVYAKAAERFKLSLRESTSTGTVALFDLSAGSVVVVAGGGTPSPTATITPVKNGWYRCSVLFNQGTTSNRTFRIFVVEDAATTANGSIASRTGDGTSGIYLWGAQLEAGSFPTSYIPTSGSSATRTQDNASITGASFNNFYNQTEGTIVSRFKGGRRFIAPSTTDNWSRVVGYGPGNRALLSSGNYAGNNNIHIYNGTQTHNIFLGPDHINGFTTAAVGFGSNSATLADAGYVADTDAGGWTTPTVDQFVLGNDGSGQYPLNGYIDKIHYYPQRLTNDQLQNLTK
jgi:hypothetical protein